MYIYIYIYTYIVTYIHIYIYIHIRTAAVFRSTPGAKGQTIHIIIILLLTITNYN